MKIIKQNNEKYLLVYPHHTNRLIWVWWDDFKLLQKPQRKHLRWKTNLMIIHYIAHRRAIVEI